VECLACPIIPEPILTRFEACNDEVPSRPEVRSGVLVWRRIAAADVTALGAAPQMKPPLTGGKTFNTSRSAWNGMTVDTI
jgi:hypothetical protein